MNRPKTLGQCVVNSGTVFGQIPGLFSDSPGIEFRTK